jgi:hypothetical protein
VIGSPVIAALFAHAAFWCLLALGWATGELELRGRTLFLALWLAGYVGLPFLGYGAIVSSFVAVLDVALVLIVFKGDVRIM